MGSLRFIKPGLFTTIQDGGRDGYAFHAVPRSGYMDKEAAELAHAILFKGKNSPLLECTLIGPTIEFMDDTEFVITGADMQWQLDEKTIALDSLVRATKNSVLSSRSAVHGFRSYIGINGELEIQYNLSSSSMYQYAGFGHQGGRPFKKGDVLRWETNLATEQQVHIKHKPVSVDCLEIIPGPEYHRLDDASKELLVNSEFVISPDTNRMGSKLRGPQLRIDSQLDYSLPVLPGFIQLPPDGQPIIILQDGQTTGGYPRIAYLRDAELNKFNQVRIGDTVKFRLLNS